MRSILTVGIILLVYSYTFNVVEGISPYEEIVDYSDFTIYHDSSLVTSVNSEDNITMIHNDESTGDTWETFLYNFTNLGNFSDFYANMTLDYEFTGSMLTQAGIEFGSNFYANGTYGGPNNLRRLFDIGIWDAWAGHGGKYYVSAYPNAVQDLNVTADGTLPSSGVVILHCNRTNDVAELKITKEGTTVISHTWSSDVSSPLNYIYLKMSINPTYCTYTSVNFTSIFVSLGNSTYPTPTTPPPTTPPTTSPPPSTPPTSTPPPSITGIFGPTAFVVGLFVIVNLTVIYIYRRRRN